VTECSFVLIPRGCALDGFILWIPHRCISPAIAVSRISIMSKVLGLYFTLWTSQLGFTHKNPLLEQAYFSGLPHLGQILGITSLANVYSLYSVTNDTLFGFVSDSAFGI
jgi:hypothetical protein